MSTKNRITLSNTVLNQHRVRESNPCYQDENLASWATRRTRQTKLILIKKSHFVHLVN